MSSILVQLGVFFVAAAALAVIFSYLRQATVLAYIAVGVILGFFRSVVHLDVPHIEILSEIGILLLLFLAGMELDMKQLRRQLGVTLTAGLGQVLSFVIVGGAVAYLVLGAKQPVTLIYLGLCLAFSSTIIVIKLLKDRKEVDSFHGQTLIGVLILQDVVAIFAIVFLKSMGTDTSMLVALLSILGKMLVIGLLIWLVSRFLLEAIFARFARSQELLFIGTLGYVFGIAAACELIGFSPELGAFLGGVSLATLRYRLEIEDKVEPIKNLGVILFFVTLGFTLDISGELLQYLPAILIMGLLVVLGTPMVMLIIGYFRKLTSRPLVFMGFIINQISEFSLILATLALRAGIFGQREFLVITFASIFSILVSSMGHSFLDKLYAWLKRPLGFVDRHAFRMEDAVELAGLKLEDHVVLLEYNEITDMVADHLAEKGEPVIIVDFDPQKIDHIEEHESKLHHAIYADPLDPDIWEALKLEKADLVVSGIARNHEAELQLLHYLKEHKSKARFVIHADNHDEAIEMYEADKKSEPRLVAHVLTPSHLAGDRLVELVELLRERPDEVSAVREDHIEQIRHVRGKFMQWAPKKRRRKKAAQAG